jgi:hypothetical protein
VRELVIDQITMPVKLVTLMPCARIQAEPYKSWAAFSALRPVSNNKLDVLNAITRPPAQENAIRGTVDDPKAEIGSVSAVTELNAGMNGFGQLTFEVTL